MFCAFEGAALILRLYGRAQVMQFDHSEFDSELKKFPGFTRARNIIFVDVDRVADSCGWGVPFYEFKETREQLRRSVEHRTQEEWEERRYTANVESIDGLKGLERGR